jgi:ABC-type transporter Mla subunit MlaD
VPFNPQGYRFEVAFRDAQELATEADVRIAGVTVGKVIQKNIDPAGNRTIAVIQMNNKYAPIHEDGTAILRTKTLLGETYVQITPGSRFSPPVPDGGLLPRGQVQPAVQLDTIFNAFDLPTRTAFQTWQQQLAVAIRNNDVNLNNVFGNLPTFAADAADILTVLDVEHSAVVNLVRNGGTVFGALSQDQSALRNLITSSDVVFRTTADNNNKLAEIFKIFPTFLDESKATMKALQSFSLNADPVIKGLIPAANALGPTLRAVQQLSPDLHKLFVNLDPLITVSRTGLPATAEFLRGLNCLPNGPNAVPNCPSDAAKNRLLPALGNFLEQINPVLNWLGLHDQLLSDFISNGGTPLSGLTTATGGSGVTCDGVPCGHYLRQFGPSGSSALGIYASRPSNNRGNDYPPPLWLADPRILVRGDYPAWDCRNARGEHGPSQMEQACWVADPLPLTGGRRQTIPHLMAKKYPGT